MPAHKLLDYEWNSTSFSKCNCYSFCKLSVGYWAFKKRNKTLAKLNHINIFAADHDVLPAIFYCDITVSAKLQRHE